MMIIGYSLATSICQVNSKCTLNHRPSPTYVCLVDHVRRWLVK